MAISAQYQEISVEGLPALSERMQTEGHRFVQVLAVNTEAGIDVQYTFMKDGVLEVFTIKGVTPEIPIPSITDRFIAAFVFENEIHDLFGVNVRDIAIDFGGNFYVTAQPSPMTIISPAQKAAREKAKKAAAAKAERARQAAAANASFVTSHPDAKGKVSGVAPSADVEDIELKIARVKAALAAKAKRAEAEAQAARPQVYDEALEAKLSAMDPEKAAKVRAAMAAKAKLSGMEPEKAQAVRGALANEAKMESQRATGQATAQQQAELDAKLAQLDPEKAAKVRAALDARARQETAQAEHDEKVAVLEERLKNMDPEKAAKVRAAFEEKQRQAQENGKAGE